MRPATRSRMSRDSGDVAESFCTSDCDPRNACAAGFDCDRTSAGSCAGVGVPVAKKSRRGGCHVTGGVRARSSPPSRGGSGSLWSAGAGVVTAAPPGADWKRESPYAIDGARVRDRARPSESVISRRGRSFSGRRAGPGRGGRASRRAPLDARERPPRDHGSPRCPRTRVATPTRRGGAGSARSSG